MGTYALRRALQMIPLLLVISLVIFGLTALQPGDPVDQLVFATTVLRLQQNQAAERALAAAVETSQP